LSGRVGLYEGNYLSVAGNKLTPLKATLSRITADVGEFVGAVGIFEDITEKKKMEEHLLRVEKLESVGLLAGGIAHDFNNILTVITGNVALAKMKAGTIDDDYRVAVLNVLTEAEKASLQAKDLTQQLLTFARGGAPILKTASMTELLKDTTGFALRGSNVRCKFNIPEDLWPVKIDVGQINQVIHNLIINADQAMPEGGIIKVGAANLTISEEHNLPLAAGEYVKISLEDQGIGIPEEHLSKIFDPYFTTKQKGTGLGLTTSYSIIRKHEGYITVESELGVGTTFHVYLQASPQESLKYKNQEEKAFSGKGKILVMDDEKMLRYVVGEMLTHIGYEVACTKDGAEAVELYKKSKAMNNPFDAVIMDLTIPGGMGGKEAVKKLIEIDPDVRAIVSSGYSNDPVMANYPEYGFKAVVAKPYSIEELGKVLESVIS
jgi:signal transduction histidine kinase/ActR/RegA family two-component response regulator